MPEDDLLLFDPAHTDPVTTLLHKKLLGESLSVKEQALLETWQQQAMGNQALGDRLEDPAAVQQMLCTWHSIEKNREQNKQRSIRRIGTSVPAVRSNGLRVLRRRYLRYTAAACLLGAGIGWLLIKNKTTGPGDAKTSLPVVIGPGRQGAVLTLADGSQMVLDSMGNGVVASQHGTQVYLQNGQLTYHSGSNHSKDVAVVYNTISTPKGREFRLLLPDGSKVWLNAASAIRYPTAFTGNERQVELDGEAYFEVAKNVRQPFKVAVGQEASITVLGTSFDINAYRNEAQIKTTLIEGAVRMSTHQQSQTLHPGQQGAVKPATEQINVMNQVDLDQVIAWKNGLFNFDDANLEAVMRQLERWYDITVVYPKGVPAARFGGEINKQNTLQDVLQILEKSNVHFRLEGRQLVVLP